MKFLDRPLILLAVGLLLVSTTLAAPKPESSSENEFLPPVEDLNSGEALSKENLNGTIAVDPNDRPLIEDNHHGHGNRTEEQEQEPNGLHRPRPHGHRRERNRRHEHGGHKQPEEQQDNGSNESSNDHIKHEDSNSEESNSKQNNNDTIADELIAAKIAAVPALIDSELTEEQPQRPKLKGRLSIACLFCFFECNCDE